MTLPKSTCVLLCLALAACSNNDLKQAKAPAAVKAPPAAVTHAWLDEYEPKVKEAINGSQFEFERKDNVLLVTLPVDKSFNPDRPNMLLSNTLGPLSRLAKLVEHDDKVGVLILGHADTSGSLATNQKLSIERAGSVTAIFRLSGLQNDRLTRKGVGVDMPRAANDSPEGRALNRRVEIMLTRKDTLAAMLAKYSRPACTEVAQTQVKAEKDKTTLAKNP